MADTPHSSKDAEGRAKEAAGSLTGDDDLKREGKTEQAGESVKAGIDKLTDKAKDVGRKD